MAVCLKNGEILLLRSFDDVIPQVSLRLVKTFCTIYLENLCYLKKFTKYSCLELDSENDEYFVAHDLWNIKN